MRKIIFLLLLACSMTITAKADTRITIGTHTITIPGDGKLPHGGNYVFDLNPKESTTSWSFPVYWADDEGSGSFVLSGDDSVTFGDIINWIIDMFW